MVDMAWYIMLCCLVSVSADIYLHNPRGSNNRLDEQGRERNNANRLFDSQNNNRGGYNVGSLYYYSGSRLQIEWTNQHSCGAENNHCEIIIQYMCGDNLRDGATTTTIPENLMDCEDYNCNTDKRYGMHESYDYYMQCKMRQRNMGLFIADQKVGSAARNTRQNPNGNRRGYECPEERDYYPYWHGSPWKDIVVMTNDATRCPYYEQESQNVKSRWHCRLPRDIMYKNMNNHHLNGKIPNKKEKSTDCKYPKDDPEGVTGQWVEIPAHGISPPECMENQFSRDNHLGNGDGGYPLSYNWTLPDIMAENCALRIRYNISTTDYTAWEDVDSANNRDRKKDYAELDLSSQVGLQNKEAALERGYKFKNNPEVEIFPGLDVEWRLAINTAQFGRTFQDRSHTFAIRHPPEGMDDLTIHNLNVRGKRGNIVQVYPAVEYDFIPNTLQAKEGEMVHIQWTGSNTNPHNNDGQGLRGSDRSNIVLQAPQAYSEGSRASNDTKHGHWGRSYPEMLDSAKFLGFTREDMVKMAILAPGQFRGEMSELDDAGTYFDLGPRKITMSGVFHYLSTRNNNFSNRSQKGKIVVRDYEMAQKSIGWNGGRLELVDGTKVVVPQGAFQKLHNVRIEKWDKDVAKEHLKSAQKIPPNDDFAGDVLVVHPEEELTADEQKFEIHMNYESNGLQETVVYVSETETLTWMRVDSDATEEGLLLIDASRGGMYVATNQIRGGAVAGIVIGVLVLIAAIVLAVVCIVRKPPAALQRHFANKI